MNGEAEVVPDRGRNQWDQPAVGQEPDNAGRRELPAARRGHRRRQSDRGGARSTVNRQVGVGKLEKGPRRDGTTGARADSDVADPVSPRRKGPQERLELKR